MLIGGVDFSDLQLTLKGAQPPAEAGGEPIAAVTVNYGMFLNTVLDFVIIAFAIFMVIKAMNTLERKKQKQPAPKPPEDTKDQKLLGEIRDLLKTRAS
jgi:large conductance mechanosensitive channel